MKISRLRNFARATILLLIAVFGVSTANARVEPSIPFANHGGIYDWRANGTKGIWVEGADRQWYYGTFFGTCWGLDTAFRVGFVPEATGEFSRWSSIVVPHENRCQLSTFQPSDAPQGRSGHIG